MQRAGQGPALVLSSMMQCVGIGLKEGVGIGLKEGGGMGLEEGGAPVERLFLRRSLPARSTRKSLPTLTLWGSCWRGWAAAPALTVPAPPPTGRLAMVSMTMAWLRLECAFRLVKANTLHACRPGSAVEATSLYYHGRAAKHGR